MSTYERKDGDISLFPNTNPTPNSPNYKPEVKVGEVPPVLFEWKKAVMSDSETDSAQAWLDHTPLDFFYDAPFENECQEWQEPPLSLQP